MLLLHEEFTITYPIPFNLTLKNIIIDDMKARLHISMKEAVKCCMQVWMYIRDFLAIVCTKEGEIIRKGKIRTNEKEIREFFYGLKNVKVAIEASTNYSYIVDALAKEGYFSGTSIKNKSYS